MVGLLWYEVLISVAQEIYSPSKHPTAYGIMPSRADPKRMLEAISPLN